MNKNILRSKTFWVQLSTFAAAFLPPVQAWLASNPIEVLGAIAALNTLVRFATKGGVSLFSEEKGNGITPVILAVGTAAALMGALPSCTTTTAPDGTVTKAPDKEAIQEGTGFARWLYEVFTFERDRAAEEAVEVEATK